MVVNKNFERNDIGIIFDFGAKKPLIRSFESESRHLHIRNK
jgi:hypothetical protein